MADTTHDNREELFAKFNVSCSNGDNTAIISDLYVRAMEDANIIAQIQSIVKKVPSTKTYNNHPRWELKDVYFIYTETTGSGAQYIYVREITTEKLVFAIINAKFYNKSGAPIYYSRSCNDKTMAPNTPKELVERALDGNMPGIRRYIFNELSQVHRSKIITAMKACEYEIYIINAEYCIPEGIPRDFEITYAGAQEPLRVHKFVAACFSEFLCKLIYGTGEIKGVDRIDLSAFTYETVKWFTELIYIPKISCSDLNADQWELLNYINVDIDGAIMRECCDLNIFQ
ncbi:methyltransferase [Faustovirus]|nr:methyltransferase [Faustovirus]QJX73660.1 methyltransferase [Faustovirus]